MELRLLLMGATPTWLPPFQHRRLLIGSAPTADFRIAGTLPFHCLVEATARAGEGALVHDLSQRGDVRDVQGRPAPPSGLRVAAGERFALGPHVLALVLDASLGHSEESPKEAPCLVCGATVASQDAHGRTVGALFVCSGCLGVIDIPLDACPGYELVARLGSGAMGAVYLALHRVSGEPVAIKLLRPSSGAEPTPSLVARFLREIRVLAQLRHPHVVRVIDAGQAAGRLYLVSELVTGGDALARVRRQGPLEPHLVARIGSALADALALAHSRGIVHRDVKPANVLLTPDGTPKLSDFGLAKELAAAEEVGISTGSNAVLGTVTYAAPEQLRDGRSAGPPADVFGLGATLYHLVTGRTPREAVSFQDLGRRKLDAAPPSAMSVAPACPRELSDALDRTLRANPRERPTPHELKILLAPLLETLDG